VTGFGIFAAAINLSKIVFALSGVILGLRTFLPGADIMTIISSISGSLAALSTILK